VARFAISFGLLLIPATFMGATLPVLSHFLVKSRSGLGRTVGALYAVNSFGAVLGAVAAGFVLLPEFGKSGTKHLGRGIQPHSRRAGYGVRIQRARRTDCGTRRQRGIRDVIVAGERGRCDFAASDKALRS